MIKKHDKVSFDSKWKPVGLCDVDNSTYVLSRPASATSTGWRGANLAIRALRVFLLDVSVKRRVAQVSFRAVAAFEISSFDVIL